MKDKINEFLNIPDRLLVGYVNRGETFTGKLAYVTYYKKGGVIAKEVSWKGWRDKAIEPDEFDNVPTEGFEINKSVSRDGRWSNRFIYCRVYDPRGFEFEISIDNLLFILQICEYDPMSGFKGKFVYAWNKQELILLPVISEDYKASRRLLDASSTIKFSAKDLVPGKAYKTKLSDTAYYLGKLDWKIVDYDKVGKMFVKISKYHSFLVKSEDSLEPDEVFRDNNLGNIFFEKEDVSDLNIGEVSNAIYKFKQTLAGNTEKASELRIDPVSPACMQNWTDCVINKQIPKTKYPYADAQGVEKISDTKFVVYDFNVKQDLMFSFQTGATKGNIYLEMKKNCTISINTEGVVIIKPLVSLITIDPSNEFIDTLEPIQNNHYMDKTWSVKIGENWYTGCDNINGVYKYRNKIKIE